MNENRFLIREATIHDSSLIASFGARTFKESYTASNSLADLTEYISSNFSVTHIRELLIDQASTFLLAYLDDNLVGYSMLLSGDSPVDVSGSNPIELVRIYIDRDHASKGLGSSLLDTCLRHAVETGHDVMWLGVWEKNEPAIAFYKKWEFKQIGMKEFVLGNDIQVDLIMSRNIHRNA